MSHNRRLDYLNKHRIIYRRNPINDLPTESYDWGDYYEDGTSECYDLFKSRAKINTYKSLKWHMLVIWYLNPQLSQDRFESLMHFVCNKNNGFITFSINEHILNNMIYETSMMDLENPPINKSRKIIFKEFTGLSFQQKMSIVGKMVGKSSNIDAETIYQCMLDINDMNEKITWSKIANLLNCSVRTIQRHLNNTLRKEKELLNEQL
jgi:hypothetical protein